MNLNPWEKYLSVWTKNTDRKNWQLEINCYNISMRYTLPWLFLIFPLLAHSSPAEEPKEFRIPILDSAQEIFGANANFAANRLDAFFATDRADDEFGRSRIRIRSRYTLRDHANGDQENQYRINLRLPHLEQRFRYDFDDDEGDGKDKKKKEKDVRSEAEVKELIKRDRLNKSWIFNADMGVSAAVPPKLTTRARLRRNFVTGTLIHRFVEQLTYVTDDTGLEELTEVNSDHIFSEEVLFRFVNSKTWQIREQDFRTNHGPTLLHRITDDDAFNYGAFLQTVIDEGVWYVNNYRLQIQYRRNLYKQWVYFDVVPGLDFPKEWSFRRTPFLVFQLELLFGSN